MGVDQALDAGALHRQVRAVRQWIQARWPDARPIVESPLMQVLGNGQRVVGRTDLLLRTATGWVLLDHKSTPQGSGQWEQVANDHAAQLAAYAEGVGAASGIQVEDAWLVLPVAGAALRVELFGGISEIR
jgi:hypothetical protein